MTDRLKYRTNGELREGIAYAVGADPARYGHGSRRKLTVAHTRRIAETLQPADSDAALSAMTIGDLYDAVCRWAGGDYSPNAGNPWGINRSNLKKIHRAVDAQPLREVVADA